MESYDAMSHSDADIHARSVATAAYLNDKESNSREPLNHTPHTHIHTHKELQGNTRFNPGGLGTEL